MIERGLLSQDSELQHQEPKPQEGGETPTAEAQKALAPGADTAPEIDFSAMLATAGSGSKLNKLLSTPTINKINYMENYKLICPSSSSITSSAIKSNQKSVIQKGPNSEKRELPLANVTSVQQLPVLAKDTEPTLYLHAFSTGSRAK